MAWTAADLAGGQCGPRGRLGVRQFFRILSGFLPDEELINQAEGTSDVDKSKKDSQDSNTVSQVIKNETGDLLRQASSLRDATPADSSGVSSVTNALEMLHFLGVVPSIEQLTESQQQSPNRRVNRRRPLSRGRSSDTERRRSRFRGGLPSVDENSTLIITEEERRGGR